MVEVQKAVVTIDDTEFTVSEMTYGINEKLERGPGYVRQLLAATVTVDGVLLTPEQIDGLSMKRVIMPLLTASNKLNEVDTVGEAEAGTEPAASSPTGSESVPV